MENYHVNVNYVNHTVRPTIDEIDGYFRRMRDQNCQFVVCVMDSRHDEDRTQLKANIKDCATLKYGK